MNKQTVESLLDKYIMGSLTEEERRLLSEILQHPEHRKHVEAVMDKELHEHAFEGEQEPKMLALIRENIQREISRRREKKPAKTISLFTRNIAAAAVIILLAGLGTYWWSTFNEQPQKEVAVQKKTEPLPSEIPPGGNKAILKLADGTQIVLDSAGDGTLAQQGKVKVIKLDNGQLSYNATGLKSNEILYNTIATPRGGQYKLVLADGTKVWLNATSSLRFPVSFSGKERRVELTGEGYFEVAKNAAMPFHVAVNGLDVEVLGTHFNVNAYADESSTRTTLLEGSVKVSRGSQNSLLKPGQQAAADISGQITVDDNVNVDEVVAWKNGMFQFKSADIGTILRQAERWYDVQFEYREPVTERFTGQISRNVNAGQLLQILESTGKVHFEAKGRTVVVKP